MRALKATGLALARTFLGTAALAADGKSCCDEKGKPCCEEKDGKRMACCDKHKDHGDAHKGHGEKPAAPQPEHKH
jgi:hypothetical protein